MEELQTGALDQAAFQRVWQRVMPEDRPDCPFTVDTVPIPAPPSPAVPMMVPPSAAAPASRQEGPPEGACLGEGSARELPLLERLLDETVAGARIYRALERRWRREGLLSILAQEKSRQGKRLSAARFLITGESYTPSPTPAPGKESLSLQLRARFQAEQRLALAFFQAANTAADPCLIELYRTLGKDCQGCVKALRGWMERQ